MSVLQNLVCPKLKSDWYFNICNEKMSTVLKELATHTFNQERISLLAYSVGTHNITVVGGPGNREWNALEDLVFFCKHMLSFQWDRIDISSNAFLCRPASCVR